jgi:hypothetical protein
MGRRVIEILADSANNWNDSPMETARDEVTAFGRTIDRLARSAAAARDGRSAMIRTRPSGAGDRRARHIRYHGRKSRDLVDARGKLILEIVGDAARPRLTGALMSGQERQYSRTEELMSRCPSTDEPS